MRSRTLFGLILAFCVASVSDKIQALNIKPGLWEVTTTTINDSSLKIPAETLRVLTPEQRTRLEERINARHVGKTKATTRKQCVSLEKLKKGSSFDEAGPSCVRNVIIATATKLSVRIECDISGVKSERTFEMEALDSENVSGSIRVLPAGDNPINSMSTFRAKWIAPDCK